MNADRLLASLPRQWQGQLTPLTGGYTNRCWRLDTARGAYWLRLGCDNPALLGIDRTLELRAHSAAAEAGLAPVIRFSRPAQGLLILDWLAEPDWCGREPDLPLLMSRVARLHKIPVKLPLLDLAAQAHHYQRQLMPLAPELAVFASRFSSPLLNPAFTPVFCHHDLNAANLMGERPWLLDWEYAARGDAAFELAVIADSFELNSEQEQALLAAYRDAGGTLDWCRFQVRRPWVQWLTALWAALQYRRDPAPRYLELQRRALGRLTQTLTSIEPN
ncbi:choline kinase family protein [Oceanisphaera sp. KMM 10153]|uniref:choline kinase family protein n=1 Tax=Oceanisphaera submarina TaxID=3390193 RepID=UPI0039748C2D